MAQTYFQLLVGKDPIEKAVSRHLKRDTASDLPKQKMPVTGWITQASASQIGSLVFWTAEGLQRYAASGLLGWHASVLKTDIRVREVRLTGEPSHADRHQVVCLPTDIEEVATITMMALLERFSLAPVKHSVIVYVTRKNRLREEDVLVFEGTQSLGKFQVPAQEMIPNEHPCEASFRSLNEQSGIDSQIQFRKLGIGYGYDFQAKEFLVYHYFQSPLHSDLPDAWEFQRSVGATRRDEMLRYSWMPIAKAKASLPKQLAAKLHLLETTYPTV